MTDFEARMAALRARLAERCREDRAAISEALANDNRETLIDRAHKLAGIAGMLGAPELGEAAFALEEDLLAGREHAASAKTLMDRLAECAA